MILRATVRDSQGNDFIRTVDVQSAKDFDKVGSAASSWAKRLAKGMQLYGRTAVHRMVLVLDWVPDAPPVNGHKPPAAVGKRAHAKRRK